jgi:hypothetical protein
VTRTCLPSEGVSEERFSSRQRTVDTKRYAPGGADARERVDAWRADPVGQELPLVELHEGWADALTRLVSRADPCLIPLSELMERDQMCHLSIMDRLCNYGRINTKRISPTGKLAHTSCYMFVVHTVSLIFWSAVARQTPS